MGREDELEQLDRWWASVVDSPRALLLAGDAGIGKTALWNECLSRVRAQFHWVLSSRPVAAELKLPFTVVGDLLDGVADDALPQLPDPQRRALEGALLRSDSGQATDARTIGIAVLNVLRHLAAVAPVLIAIDDVQWVDAASARALQFALRRVEQEPIGVFATLRSGAEGAFTLDAPARMTLAPLSMDALHQLISERVGRTPSRPELRRLYRTSGGNPLYALELARHDGADVPTSLAALVEARLGTLSPRTRRALVAVALAHDPVVDVMLRAAGTTMRALQPALAAGVIGIEDGRLEFAHPLFAAIVLAGASERERRVIHTGLARAVADEDERVRHLALATETPTPGVSSALEAAAGRARGRGAPDEAVELLELARRLTPPRRAADRRRRTLEHARALFAAGDSNAARALLEDLIIESPRGPSRARAVRELGRLHYYHDNHLDSVTRLREALSEAGDDAQLSATILRDLAWAVGASGRWREVPAIARRAHALAQLSGDEALAAETNGLFMVSRVHAGKRVDLRALRRSAELMPDTADRPIEFSPSFSYATVLKALDRADEARTLLLRIRDRLAELGNDGPLAYVSTQLAENETNTGRPLDALPYVDDAVRYATQTGTLAPLAPAAYQRTLALVLAGRATEAREAASESVAQAERSGWPVGSVQTRCALGLLELSLGNVDEAARELRVLVEPATQPSVKARRLGDAVEALLAAGDLDVAAQALAELERLAAVSGRPTCAAAASRSRALLALARGDAATALPAAEESVGQFEYIDSRIELGRSLVVQGICERRMRRRAAARTTLARAVDVLDDAGAELFAGRARHELARIGGRRATQDLTPTEARIAELAAHGRRNREIAAELFVTEKTVEAALSRVYRKLGVRSRSELAGVGKL